LMENGSQIYVLDGKKIGKWGRGTKSTLLEMFDNSELVSGTMHGQCF